MKSLFWTLILSVFSFNLNAKAQQELVYSASSGQKAFVFQENKVWKVRINQYVAGWPESVDETYFKNRYQAHNFLSEKKFQKIQMRSVLLANSYELLGQEKEGIWTAKNEWSWDWEVKFSQWIQNEVDTDFFVKHKIRTDCADVMYSLRWIFARINYLPMANKTMDGFWFTHRSLKSDWAKLKTHQDWFKDERFLAAMKFIMIQSYTHTLNRDSYPVLISKEALLPGAFHLLISGKSGHTMVVYRQFPATNGVIAYVMSSTLPKDIRILSDHRIYPNIFEENKNMLLRMRWPVFNGDKVGLVDADKMPFYSREQYSGQAIDINRVLNPNPNWKLEYEDSVDSLVKLLNQRKNVVEEGHKVCYPNKCSLESSDYDTHSTPSRDNRLKQAIGYLYEEIAANYKEFDERSQKENIFELYGETFSVFKIKLSFESEFLSSDPNHSIERRWWLKPTFIEKATTEIIQDQLVTRRQSITEISKLCQNNSNNCASGTDLHKKLHLGKYQNSFAKLIFGLKDIEQVYPGSNLFNLIKNKMFSDGKHNLSGLDWIAKIHKSANDPRHSLKLIEGDLSEWYHQVLIPDGLKYRESFGKNTIILEDSAKNLHIAKIENLELKLTQIIDENELIKQISFENDWALVQVNQQLHIVKMTTRTIVYTLPEIFKNIEFKTEFEKDFVQFKINKPAVKDSIVIEAPKIIKYLVVVDLKTKKIVYEFNESDQDVYYVSLSEDKKWVSIGTAKGTSSNAGKVISYKTFKVNDPQGMMYETDINLMSMKPRYLKFTDQKVQGFNDSIYFEYNLKSKKLNNYNVHLKNESFNRLLVSHSDDASNFILSEVVANSTESDWTIQQVMQIDANEYAKVQIVNDQFVILNVSKPQAYILTIENNSIKSVKKPIQNIKIIDRDGIKVFVSYDGQKMISEVKGHNDQQLLKVNYFVSTEVYKDFLSPEHIIYRADNNYEDYNYFSTRKKQAPANINGFFDVLSSGLFHFNYSELYILK